ncbi:hypothetical protein P147_WWE3C00001G0294 [candidate division WWE3 bacterium RAAC2_WWE3_1]|nr:hypothetical protein P147_WWE3C00001G0294 [candidate division WWE3 bacterium RAAC2_WWE3_1]
MRWDENAGLSEGEGGGVDGILSRELPVTESLRPHHEIFLYHKKCED